MENTTVYSVNDYGFGMGMHIPDELVEGMDKQKVNDLLTYVCTQIAMNPMPTHNCDCDCDCDCDCCEDDEYEYEEEEEEELTTEEVVEKVGNALQAAWEQYVDTLDEDKAMTLLKKMLGA